MVGTEGTVVVVDGPAAANRTASLLEATLPVSCFTAGTQSGVLALLDERTVDCVVTELSFDAAGTRTSAADPGANDGSDPRNDESDPRNDAEDDQPLYRGSSDARGSTQPVDDGPDASRDRDGVAIVDAIRRSDPTLPVVAYTDARIDAVIDGPVLAGVTAILDKDGAESAAALSDWVGRVAAVRTSDERAAPLDRRDRRTHGDSPGYRRRRERLAGLAHDLQNPLGAANVYLAELDDDCDSPALADLAAAHERLGELVEDLDSLATAGRAVTDPDAIDVADAARTAWTTVDTGDATLRVEATASVQGDRRRVRRLFENLFANAVTHGGRNVTVTVGDLADDPADGDSSSGDQTGFFVADDGPGVPPDERGLVFERGYTTTDDGTGYGLAIVAELADAHGWRVSVTRGDRGGARFDVRTS